MKCIVEIWALDDETPRGAEVVATYRFEEAPNLLVARRDAHTRYMAEHPGDRRDLIVYGKTDRPK